MHATNMLALAGPTDITIRPINPFWYATFYHSGVLLCGYNTGAYNLQRSS